jgi:hypothetical protein
MFITKRDLQHARAISFDDLRSLGVAPMSVEELIEEFGDWPSLDPDDGTIRF